MSKKSQRLRAERAAAALREQQARERRRTTLTVVAVVAAIALIVGAGFLINRMRDTSTDVSAPAAGSEHGVTIGPADAPHTVVIYEDFLCPYCGELEARSQQELEGLAEEGKVRVEYRPLVLLDAAGDYSRRATAAFAVVLQESGPEVAKRFHDLLFANQPSEAGPFPDDAELIALAVDAGAQETQVTDEIRSGAGDTWADAATQQAEDAGVRSTPTILVDGKVFTDGRTVDQLAANLVKAVQ